jgi:EAL domain-containing protein (putative c-di-GMP-specific phosphodiesterase class I)
MRLGRLHMAVSLTERPFSSENLLAGIAAELKQAGLVPALLQPRIADTIGTQGFGRAVLVPDRFNDMGIRLAIDDFGTGYSSLSNIKRFPLDTIKVDRSFKSDVPRHEDDKAMTSAIIAAGRSLGQTVVAEGEETRAQFDCLIDHAFDRNPGYHLSTPADARQFEALLRTNGREARYGTVAA